MKHPISRMLELASTIGVLFCFGDILPQALGQGIGAVSDFSLQDVNAYSESYENSVSPRDYLEQVSGWYFSHTT